MQPRGELRNMIRAFGLQSHDVPEKRPGGRATGHSREHKIRRRVGGIQRHALLQHPYTLVRPICFSILTNRGKKLSLLQLVRKIIISTGGKRIEKKKRFDGKEKMRKGAYSAGSVDIKKVDTRVREGGSINPATHKLNGNLVAQCSSHKTVVAQWLPLYVYS